MSKRQAAASWSPRWVPAPRGVQDREVVLFSSRSAVLILKDSRLLLPSQPGVGCLPAVIHLHQQKGNLLHLDWGIRNFFLVTPLQHSAHACVRCRWCNLHGDRFYPYDCRWIV